METTCTRCGNKAIAGGLCPRCYKRVNKLMALKSTTVRHCVTCGRYLLGGRWVHAEVEDVLKRGVDKNIQINTAAKDVEISITKVPPQSVKVAVSATLGGEPWEVTRVRKFSLERASCETCAKKAGEYYEARVQVRAEGRELEQEELEQVNAATVAFEKEDAIVTPKKAKGGVDYTVAPIAIAKQIERKLKSMGAQTVESFRSMGYRHGKPINQVNVSARFPAHRAGDVVRMAGRLYRVEKIGEKTLLRDFEGGERAANQPLELVCRQDELLDGLVVSVGQSVQLMDEKYETHDFARPKVPPEQGKKVKFIRVDGMIYPIWR